MVAVYTMSVRVRIDWWYSIFENRYARFFDERNEIRGISVLADKMANLRQTPLTCSGHTRPVVHLAFSDVTECGYFLISACKGELF